MKVVSYDGTTFSSLNVAAGIPNDLPGPDVSPVLIERFGAAPVHAGLGRGARTIPVVFTVKPGNDAETTLMALLAALDPGDETERVLAAQLNNGTNVYVNAAMGPYVYLAINQLQVSFTASDPTWKKTSRSYSPGPAVTNYTAFTADGSLTVTNAGQTTALPVVRLKWTGTQRTSETANFGYKYRRTMTVKNNSTRTLRRYPVYIDLDDTALWVTASKALANGNDIRVFCNGRELPRNLIGHNVTRLSGSVVAWSSNQKFTVNVNGNTTNPLGNTPNVYAGSQVTFTSGDVGWESAEILSHTANEITLVPADRVVGDQLGGETFKIRNTWCWTVIDEIQAGQTVTLEIVYGNASAGTPPTLADAPDMPAFDLSKSSNGTWRYKLRGSAKSASASAGRGLWFVGPVGNEVASVSWDVPGAWSRLNYLDNRDDRTQARATRVTTNYTTGTSGSTATKVKISGSPAFADGQWVNARMVITISGTDYTRTVTASTADELTVAALPSAPNSTNTVKLSTNTGVFNAQRTWQDNAQYPEEGAYDGVMLSHPLGIKGLYTTYTLTNPASIAKLNLVSRASGAEDWAKDIEATATTTGTAINQSWISGAYPLQIGLALSANDDVVIPTSYGKDSGTASAGSNTTITDQTKSWQTDQWKNGTVKIVAGKSKGSVKTVTSNTATVLTISGTFGSNPDDTSRYIVTANHKASAGLTGDWLVVTLDTSKLELGALSDPETNVYDTGNGNATQGWLTVRAGGGAGGNQYPHYLMRIGGAGKRLFLTSGAILRVDCANRTVRLYDSSETTYTSVPWAVDFYKVTATGTARSSTWLPVRTGDSKLYIANASGGTQWRGSSLSLEADIEEAFLG